MSKERYNKKEHRSWLTKSDNKICPLIIDPCIRDKCHGFDIEIDSKKRLSEDEGKYEYALCMIIGAPNDIVLYREKID